MSEYDDLDQSGLLFEDGLLFAVERPKTIVFGEEVYPDLFSKAAVLVQSVAQGHLFHNGNKRTALACLYLFLYINGHDFIVDSQEAENFIVDVVTEEEFKGTDGIKNIADFIKNNSIVLK